VICISIAALWCIPHLGEISQKQRPPLNRLHLRIRNKTSLFLLIDHSYSILLACLTCLLGHYGTSFSPFFSQLFQHYDLFLLDMPQTSCLRLLRFTIFPLVVCFISFPKPDIITHNLNLQQPVVHLRRCRDQPKFIYRLLVWKSVHNQFDAIGLSVVIEGQMSVLSKNIPLGVSDSSRKWRGNLLPIISDTG
jgi:hypothetical protein